MRTLVIAAVVVAGVAALEGLYFAIRYLFESRHDELKRRLQSLGTGSGDRVSLLRPGRLSKSVALDGLLRVFSPAHSLEKLIEQADLPITVARLLALCTLTSAVGMTLGLMAGGGLALSLFLLALGFAVPILYVLFVRDRRSAKISEQLPDALDMMARSLRAGHALSTSFRLVAAELPGPINMEFGRAFEEQNLGLPFERTVENMTRRAPGNRDLKIFAVSVIVQKETGGNLAEILEKIAETIRSRYRFFSKVRALTAEGRVSGYILGALPILTGLFIYTMNPSYISMLFENKLGRSFLTYAIVSWTLGFLWMRRMTKVEF